MDSRSGRFLRRRNERRTNDVSPPPCHFCETRLSGLPTTHHVRSGRAQPQALRAIVLCRKPLATPKEARFSVHSSASGRPCVKTLAPRRRDPRSSAATKVLCHAVPSIARRCQAMPGDASPSQAVVKKKGPNPTRTRGPFSSPSRAGLTATPAFAPGLWLAGRLESNRPIARTTRASSN